MLSPAPRGAIRPAIRNSWRLDTFMALPRERTAPDSTIKPPIHEFSARYPRIFPQIRAFPAAG